MLEDKVAVVTGASSGIGREIALTLALKGAKIVVNYRGNDEEANKVVLDIENAGSKAIAVKGDVSKATDMEKLIKTAVSTFGKVDILVNNAGITKDNLLLKMTDEQFSDVIDINLKGTFNCTKAVTKYMLKQRSGKIINIASVIGIVGNAGQSNYAASKAGIIGFTKSVAKELASRGITANAVAPGFIRTKMTDILSEDVKQEILKNIPLKKFGEAQDVAKIVAYLASDDANYITGQVINIDGGMVM
ncbi:MAG TPA: 3-oxoacyl-[acyl-carrier-protein] reductase [Clostridiales bacterium]|nr:MAG: 3-oxoacyl-[acyl-carrier-protein] reductase [Clostridiales bacterium GWD2_32_19]HCC06898.1 3-oxoacyl-[acyl-carrier-protein] reductase [Clostridiales bacterium]